MQEFFFPSRLLQFGSRQLRWQCAASGMQDGYADGWKRGFNPEDSTLQLATSLAFNSNEYKYKARGSDNLKDELYDYTVSQWAALIPGYTSRRLAYATDRPWAVSGLADAWSAMIQDEYLAGLWRKSLPGTLLWHIMASNRILGIKHS